MSKPIIPIGKTTPPPSSAIIEQNSAFLNLPVELITKILMGLNRKNILSCGLICKSLNQLTKKDVIWEKLFNRCFPHLHSNEINNFHEGYKDCQVFDTNCAKGAYTTNGMYGHAHEVISLFISEGKLFSGSGDNSIKIWDLLSNRCIATLKGHWGNVVSIFIAKRTLYSSSKDYTIRVWDLDSLSCNNTLECREDWAKALVVAGGKLYFSNNNIIKVWDLETQTWNVSLMGHVNDIYTLAASDKDLFSGGIDNKIRIWNLESRVCTGVLEGHKSSICSLLVADGSLYSSSNDCTIKIWDLNSRKCTATLNNYTNAASSLAIGMGFLFSIFPDNTIRVWDLRSHNCKSIVECQSDLSKPVVFANGKLYLGRKSGAIETLDFTAYSSKVFAEIAELFANTSIYNMQHITNRFVRMPKSAKNMIYRKLIELINPALANDSDAMSIHCSHEQLWGRSTNQQKAQAIQHYLQKRYSSSHQ